MARPVLATIVQFALCGVLQQRPRLSRAKFVRVLEDLTPTARILFVNLIARTFINRDCHLSWTFVTLV